MTRFVVYLSCALVIGLVSVSAQSNADASANAGTDASGTAVAEAQANAVADAIAWDVNNDDDSEECNAPDTTEATTTVANVPQCGDNEILDNCPAKCSSDYCPKNEREASKSQLCVKPEKCPPPACKCRVNYRRNSKNVCIPTRECPPFKCSGVNEEFNPCPPFCPTDDCSQATPDGTCPKRFGRIGILLICSPKCRCMKGYWRKNGVCVPYAECNKNNQCSDPNEEYVPEKPSCPPEECNSMVARIDCTNAPPPAPGCACKSGYNRLNVTSPCIPQCQCPQLANSLECQATTGPSADVTEVTEPVTAEAPDTKEVSITTEPTEGESESLRCGINEVPGRVRSCPPERTCRNRNIAFKCAVTPYVKKCVCAKGYFRNSIGECITEAQCDQCSAPNQFYSCNSACDNECATINSQNRTNCPIQNIDCNKQCYCDDGYARDANDNCVPVSECPKIEPGKYNINKDSLDSVCTDPNEHFTCQMPCPPETCSRLVIRIRCDEQQTCVQKCACKPGFYRVEEGSPCVGICDCPQMASAPMCNGGGGVLLPPPGFRV